jgi:dolichol-phosphate mannosyltransferase
MTWADEERISVVIPALDEAGNIGRLVEETFRVVRPDLLAEVIVVDDGSTDETSSEIERLMPRYPRLRLLRHLKRSGQSSALRTGIRFSKASIIATMDGDGQNDPADISRLHALLDQLGPGTSLIGGIRRNRQADGSKRMGSKFANWLRNRVLDDGCPDTGCGIKVFRRDAFLELPFYCGMHRYLPALFVTYGHMVAYLPVNDRSREAGKSKYTNLGRAHIGIYDLIGVRWIRKRTRISPVAEVARPEAQRTAHLRVLAGVAAAPGHPAETALAQSNKDQEAGAWLNPSVLGGQRSLQAT